jgi:hypothetical protein
MKNQWITPSLATLEAMMANEMVFTRPHFRAASNHSDVVIQSTATRRLFTTARSSQDVKPSSLEDIASALSPDCPTSVALHYSHSAARDQYEPYLDVNVIDSTDVTVLDVFIPLDIVDYIKQTVSDPALFAAPSFSAKELKRLEKQTKRQSECPQWSSLCKGRISASIALEVISRTRSLVSGKTTDSSSLVSLIIIGKNLNPDLPALKYGHENEPRAADLYYAIQHGQHQNLRMDLSGLFTDGTKS